MIFLNFNAGFMIYCFFVLPNCGFHYNAIDDVNSVNPVNVLKTINVINPIYVINAVHSFHCDAHLFV